jgi:hypothetical protein
VSAIMPPLHVVGIGGGDKASRAEWPMARRFGNFFGSWTQSFGWTRSRCARLLEPPQVFGQHLHVRYFTNLAHQQARRLSMGFQSENMLRLRGFAFLKPLNLPPVAQAEDIFSLGILA